MSTFQSSTPTNVLDKGFALPLGFVSALGLWQQKRWGYLLSGLLLVMMAIETVSIAVDQYFGHLHDPAASLDAVPLFIGLSVVGWIVLDAYLNFFYSKSITKEE